MRGRELTPHGFDVKMSSSACSIRVFGLEGLFGFGCTFGSNLMAVRVALQIGINTFLLVFPKTFDLSLGRRCEGILLVGGLLNA